MTMAHDRKLRALYAGLTPRERARLLTRLSWGDDNREVVLLRDSVPPAERGAFRRAAGLQVRLLFPTSLLLATLLRRAERDRARLLPIALWGLAERRRELTLRQVWQLVPYPVTESEHRVLLGRERAEPIGLAAFAQHVARTYAGVPVAHPSPGLGSVVARLAAHPDGAPLDGPTAWVRAAIDEAVERRELPRPEPADGGPTLGRGELSDWLEGPGASRPMGPAHHVPGLAAIGGDTAWWEVRPDPEAGSVRARREELVAGIGRLAGLGSSEPSGPDPHPPLTAAALERARGAVARHRARPNRRAEVRERLRRLGDDHALTRAELRAYLGVLEEIGEQVFGGGDPLPPSVRELLNDVAAEVDAFGDEWQRLGADLAGPGDDAWPPVPEVADRHVEGYGLGLRRMLEDDGWE